MKKHSKINIVLVVIMAILMFIPTFNYKQDTFSVKTKTNFHWGGSIQNSTWYAYDYLDSDGTEDCNESIFVYYRYSANDNVKVGFWAIVAGLAIIFLFSLLKIRIAPLLCLIGSCMPIVGLLLEVYGFYNHPHVGLFEVNNPPYIAFLLGLVSLVSVVVSIKSLTAKEENPQEILPTETTVE